MSKWNYYDDDDLQDIVDSVYGGNRDELEADLINNRRNVISWDAIQQGAELLPEWEPIVHKMIERRLGYLPETRATIQHESFLRALFSNLDKGGISEEDCEREMQIHMKHIRNADMRMGNWLVNLTYGEYHRRKYETYLPELKDLVRDRLTRFLGYVPKIEYSLEAEIFMREVLRKDTIQIDDEINVLDWKLLTVIKYRETLLEHGHNAADTAPLLRSNFYGLSKQNL